MENQPIRIIDQTPPPERFARGWHTLGLSKSFSDKPVGVNAFGKKLVVFRNSAGKAIALQAACPHMGGDLSMGKIDGDMVRCPYHEWGWGAGGRCLDIPYAKKIPKEACIQSWETLEENNLLFIWNDPEGENLQRMKLSLEKKHVFLMIGQIGSLKKTSLISTVASSLIIWQTLLISKQFTELRLPNL